MRLVEHQSKKLLHSFGVPFTQPVIAATVAEALTAFETLGSIEVVLKAQVPFGGRGKSGAVQFVSSQDEVRVACSKLFGMNLKNVVVERISIEPKIKFVREYYVGVTWDTVAKKPVAILSIAGGVEVESSGADHVAKTHFCPWDGMSGYQGRQLAAQLGLTGKTLTGIGGVFEKLSKAFLATDALTMEINPIVETPEGSLIGLDAHIEIEDDAGWRQKGNLEPLGEIVPTATGRPPTPLEIEAQRIDAMDHRGVAGRVVEFPGQMALLIGGGGASLTVFDAIQRHGGKPANYCEVGGNPTEEKVAALTALLLAKPGVKSMAVIMNVVNNTRADVMARGVIMGCEQAGKDPAKAISVFRIPGSWEKEATDLLSARGVKALGREVSLNEAARLAVERSR